MADIFNLDANKMGISNATDSHICKVVNEQLKLIKRDIKTCHEKDNISSLDFNLPYSINVPGLPLHKAQLHVYYQITKVLTDKNFDVKIDINNEKNSTTLYIKWRSFFDDSEEVKKKMFLQKLSTKHEEDKAKRKRTKKIDKIATSRADQLIKKPEKIKNEYMIPYLNELSDSDSDDD